MASSDPRSDSEMQCLFRLAERATQWHREILDIKTPEEALQRQVERIQSVRRGAFEEAELCVEDPGLRPRHAAAWDLARRCDFREAALKPDCNCKNEERWADFLRAIDELKCNLEGVLRQATPSRDEISTSPERERRVTPFSSEEQEGRSVEDSTGITPSPQSAATSPPALSGRDVSQAASRDAEQHESGEQQGPSGAIGLDYANITSDEVGHGTIVHGSSTTSVAEASHHTKRKAANDSMVCASRQPKRGRFNETGPTTANGDSIAALEATAHPRPGPPTASRRSIEFEDLYQNGNARYKHFIAVHEGRLYILRCDKHSMHFGDRPLKGAVAHLAKTHWSGKWTFSRAVDALGIEVLNCDWEKQSMNNNAFRVALAEGYTPLNNQTARRPQRPGLRPAVSGTRSRDQRGMEEAVPSPIPGEIYLAYWGGSGEIVGIIVLPIDCFSNRSFTDIGLHGSLASDTPLLTDVPACYRTCPNTGNIIGWEDGYEDGAERVGERVYPVMYFDGVESLRKASVAWMPVKDIREYNRGSWANYTDLISNYGHLQQFEARREEARRAARRQTELTSGAQHLSEAAEAQVSQRNMSSSSDQGAETIDPLPEATSSSTGPVTLGSGAPSVDSTDVRRSQATVHPSQTVPSSSGTLMSALYRHSSYTSTAFRPTQSSVVGHAAMHGDGVPPYRGMDQGTWGSGRAAAGRGTEDLRDTAHAALAQTQGQFESTGSGDHAQARQSLLPASYGEPAGTRMMAEEVARSATVAEFQTDSTETPAQNSEDVITVASTLDIQVSTDKAEGNRASTVPPQNTTATSAARALGGPGSRDQPVDLEAWEDSPTTPAFDMARRTPSGMFSPFKRSFEHSVATTSDSEQHWTIPDGMVVGTRGEVGEGPPAAGDAGVGRVPEAAMMGGQYQWVNTFDA